ncbi:MAG: 50S ribosomal protein L30 [Leptospiraceae bacterium]|nr:50S ribosomal protein L30 [Leptospiraceae bacterium]MDW8306065.1 50S ribosomal protein L30 [Leptospiraceae bacterium]
MMKVRVTQVRSQSRKTKKQKRTLQALGLRKIGDSREHIMNPAIKGMIDKVSFLVKVEELP